MVRLPSPARSEHAVCRRLVPAGTEAQDRTWAQCATLCAIHRIKNEIGLCVDSIEVDRRVGGEDNEKIALGEE